MYDLASADKFASPEKLDDKSTIVEFNLVLERDDFIQVWDEFS